MKPEQYKYYEAEVRVKNKATLKPDANLTDGQIIKVQAGWIMDEEDTSQFVGQFAFLQQHDYWIPEEDLIIKKEISFKEYCH